MKINIQNTGLAVTAGLVAQFPDGRKPQGGIFRPL